MSPFGHLRGFPNFHGLRNERILNPPDMMQNHTTFADLTNSCVPLLGRIPCIFRAPRAQTIREPHRIWSKKPNAESARERQGGALNSSSPASLRVNQPRTQRVPRFLSTTGPDPRRGADLKHPKANGPDATHESHQEQPFPRKRNIHRLESDHNVQHFWD